MATERDNNKNKQLASNKEYEEEGGSVAMKRDITKKWIHTQSIAFTSAPFSIKSLATSSAL